MRIKSLFFVRLILSMQHFTRHFYATAGVPETRQIYLAKTLEEKRKLYRCKENYVQLKEIPTWPEFYQKNQIDLKNKKTPQASFNGTLNNKIAVFTGDITCLEIDSIVNAANNRMLGGGGVDGAIHKAAGSLLYDECKTLNGCKTGEAKITAGYNLPAKYVIHTVGPQDQNPDDLRNSYLNSLKLAIENKCRTIVKKNLLSTFIVIFLGCLNVYLIKRHFRVFQPVSMDIRMKKQPKRYQD